MAYSLNKMWTAMAASLIAAAGVVSAAPNFYETDYSDSYGQQQGNFNYGQQQGNFNYGQQDQGYQGYGQSNDYGNGGNGGNGGNSGHRPAIDGCGNLFFSADALYLKPSVDGIPYGVVSTPETTGTVVGTELEVLDPKFRWEWGYKLGAGYDFSCGWDIRAYWTHYNGKAHSTTTLPTAAGSVLYPTFGANTAFSATAGGTIDTLSSSYRLRLDLADFELGREFCCGPCVSVRPHVGIRAAWIKQRLRNNATGTLTTGDVVSPAGQGISMKSDFEGVGLRGGLDTQWNVGCGFSVYGNVAVSAVYGRYHNQTNEVDVVFATGATTVAPLSQFDHFHTTRFMGDLALGLKWQQAYCDDSIILTLQVGYQQYIFINQNRLEDFASNRGTSDGALPDVGSKNSSISRGDVSLQGLTFGLKLDF